MKHTLVVRVRDEPGVLNRVTRLFSRRNFNIDSLTVGGSERPDCSRMTIVVDTRRVPARLVEANLRKLVPVIEVEDVTHRPTVSRDLALIRVRCAPNERSELASLVSIFRGRIVDVAADSVIVEVTGAVEKVDGLIALLQPRGIEETVRTGKVALLRGSAQAGAVDRGPGGQAGAGAPEGGLNNRCETL
jgi:acetolactate synthase-1/3 small subunit